MVFEEAHLLFARSRWNWLDVQQAAVVGCMLGKGSSPSLLLSRGGRPVSDKGLGTEMLAFVILRLILERILNSKTICLVQNMVFLC